MTLNTTPHTHLETVFGPLEIKVLDALWSHNAAACVRDLQPRFPNVAYTTLMTTLDLVLRVAATHLRARRAAP